nr:hypothetical protein [Saccharothrix sp. ALI-22-I]
MITTEEGWAVLLPDGSYRVSGDLSDNLWWAVKLSRFEVGELDPYVPEIRKIPDDMPIPGIAPVAS